MGENRIQEQAANVEICVNNYHRRLPDASFQSSFFTSVYVYVTSDVFLQRDSIQLNFILSNLIIVKEISHF